MQRAPKDGSLELHEKGHPNMGLSQSELRGIEANPQKRRHIRVIGVCSCGVYQGCILRQGQSAYGLSECMGEILRHAFPSWNTILHRLRALNRGGIRSFGVCIVPMLTGPGYLPVLVTYRS